LCINVCFLYIGFQHGEPGVAVVDLQPVDVVVEHVLKQILSQVSFFCFTILLAFIYFCLFVFVEPKSKFIYSCIAST
jgi:hypothetical protein